MEEKRRRKNKKIPILRKGLIQPKKIQGEAQRRRRRVGSFASFLGRTIPPINVLGRMKPIIIWHRKRPPNNSLF